MRQVRREMDNRDKDPTRREFLLNLAKKTGYLAPVITTFAVAPELLAAQGKSGSPPGKGLMKGKAPFMSTAPSPPGERPSDKHPPPSQKP